MAQLETSALSARRRAPPSLGADVRPPAMKMAGEYDVTTVGELSAMFSSAIAADDADLVVDLREVTFMDAATINVIVRARVFLGVHGRGLRLRAPSRCARRLLTVCDLGSLLQPDPRPSLSLVGTTPVASRPEGAASMRERR